MFKCCPLPASERSMVATLAVGTECKAGVIRICCTGQVTCMANFTLGRSTRKLLSSTSCMAGLAVGHCVNTGQGEPPIGVLNKKIGLRFPIPRNMTILTLIPELPLVVVGVTIGAGRSNVTKHQFAVTGTAGYALM